MQHARPLRGGQGVPVALELTQVGQLRLLEGMVEAVVVQLFQGQIILGVVLIIVGCLVGPGGYSIFQRRS